ncbi:MAG: Xaa-Pro aminopeptidase [Actinomycetota bacterium]|jgi:Xaa-Pro aminopeptidase|nr:Xaa-Pro aminopeptidase [Actinomycetota bacterium]
MTTYLLHDNALRSFELRHEIGEPVGDSVAFIEHDGKRILVGSDLEAATFSSREDVVDEYWTFSSLGIEELVRDEAFPRDLLETELTLRALKKLSVSSVVVPPTFQLHSADHLRANGVEVVVNTDVWVERRRRKTPWEIEGLERAQRAVETAMLTAARMLREAEPTSGDRLRYEGEILTSEWIRESMSAALLSQGAESEEILVQSGDACLDGHLLGSGPIAPDRSVLIDCFPRDRRTGVYTDMTRTFVAGQASEDLKSLHKHVRTALELAFESIKPGEPGPHNTVSEYFHSQGFGTQAHHTGEGAVKEGFTHALGHGVGLEVHERPYLGRRADVLQEGDVVAVEPGLYVRGIGGVRLEDTILVTDKGVEHITDPFPYDLEP